ncbi:hypothetical protein J6590_065398 [Homalodisca vitripennis]|nr:hypothetical protein J6590_065398 [Homalodisca vitripennis]
MSSDEEDVLLLAAATCVLLCDREPRRFWVKPSLASRGVYSGSDLFKDLNPRELTCSKNYVEANESIYRGAWHRLAWHIGSKRLTSSSVLLMVIFHKLFDGGAEGH